jgi:hypothetical protein
MGRTHASDVQTFALFARRMIRNKGLNLALELHEERALRSPERNAQGLEGY